VNEKRRVPRLNRRFILRVAAFGETPLLWSFVTIHNLSADGILFTYDRKAHPGMLFHFKIDFPDRLIECMGRVVRIGAAGKSGCHDIAARLEGIDSEALSYIEGFVSASLP